MQRLLTVTDQMHREVTCSFPPKRIISLVPSQTEFLLDIGAPVIGRTKFCIHPKSRIGDVPIIGGTKNFRFEKIQELQPDLIIGNREENYEQGINRLASDFPVWMSDITTFDDAFNMMQCLGEMCGLERQSLDIIFSCRAALEKVKGMFSGRIIYLIWKDPWMAAGKNTFIDHLLKYLGYENLITEERYPEMTDEQIKTLKPDQLLFSSEPYPFKPDHLKEANVRWPNIDSRLIDGEMYSWYGSRLRHWQHFR